MHRALARLTIWLLVACFGSSAGVRAASPMVFRDACTANTPSAQRIVVAGVGDLLFHEVLQRQALTPETDYASYFAAVAPVLTGADITYGNLEGPAAHGVLQGGKDAKDPGRVYDGKVYGTAKDALIFNYHPSVAVDLKAAGFSVVSTANNHAADRRSLGIDRTIDALDAAGLPYTGTRRP
jgi:Bacterial capsule synthesis protein PGA_cap